MKHHDPMSRPECLLAHIKENFYIVENMGIVRSKLYSSTLNKWGYLQFKVPNKETGKREVIVAHHIAWFLYYDKWPARQIDHEDRDKLNNSKDNLREVNIHTQVGNRDKVSDLPLGVKHNKNRNYYEAYISISGKNTYVGGGNTPEKAAAKYIEAYNKLYPGEEM